MKTPCDAAGPEISLLTLLAGRWQNEHCMSGVLDAGKGASPSFSIREISELSVTPRIWRGQQGDDEDLARGSCGD